MRSHSDELLKRVMDSMGLKPDSPMSLEQVQEFNRMVWQVKKDEARAVQERKKDPKPMSLSVAHVFGTNEKSESPIEELLLLNMNTRSTLIGEFIQQHQVGPYRLDFAFVRAKLYIEADGRHHRRDPGQHAHDQRRGQYLASLGWTALRFTGQQIYESAAEIAERIEKMYQALLKAGNLPEPWEK